MTMFSTHYDDLQVARRSTDAVIRAAYRVLCQKYHPDKFDGDSAEAERIMKVINHAYAVLSDPVQRATHDARIREQEDGTRNAEASKQNHTQEKERREQAASRAAHARADDAGHRYREGVEQKKQEKGSVASESPAGGASRHRSSRTTADFGHYSKS